MHVSNVISKAQLLVQAYFANTNSLTEGKITNSELSLRENKFCPLDNGLTTLQNVKDSTTIENK